MNVPGRCAEHGGLMWSNAMRACITPDDVIRGACRWEPMPAMPSDRFIAAVADAIAIECGRCHGEGTERHQLDRDPAAGYGEHPCPNCHGSGHTVMHGTPGEVARRAIERSVAMTPDRAAILSDIDHADDDD